MKKVITILIPILLGLLLTGCSDNVEYVTYNVVRGGTDSLAAEPRLTRLEFLAADNPELLVDDVACTITGDSVAECWVPHVMSGKRLVARFTVSGTANALLQDTILSSAEVLANGERMESSMRWENETYYPTRGYKFTYDDANRLTMATYGEGSSISYYGKYSERLEYDAHGNATRIYRYGKNSSSGYGLMDDLTLSYDGNRLTGVSEAAADYDATGTFEYKRAKGSQYMYDSNGSLIADKSRGIAYITYDPNGNPQTIYFTNGCMTKYTYSATGQKLSVVHYIAMPNVTWAFGVKPDAAAQSQAIFAGQTDYLLGGSLIVYDGSIRMVLFDGGYASATRVNFDTYNFSYIYYNRDHLGNNREAVNARGDVVQVTNYYPFGAPYADAAAATGSAMQQYKYNGKELDVTHGLNTYDYGARQLDPILGRWDRMDPLCEKDYQTSPYVYCGNNPVNRVDKDGRIWDTFLDVAFLAYDLGEATYQLFTAGSVSNTTKAALGADAMAAVVPGLTGTGLAVRAGMKASSKSIGVAKGAEKALEMTDKSTRIEKLRESAEIGQEAHRQIEKELMEKIGGQKEVTMRLNDGTRVRKDFVKSDGTCVIIKPDTPSGRKSAQRRTRLMESNSKKTEALFYNPNDKKYLECSPTYIGPHNK